MYRNKKILMTFPSRNRPESYAIKAYAKDQIPGVDYKVFIEEDQPALIHEKDGIKHSYMDIGEQHVAVIPGVKQGLPYARQHILTYARDNKYDINIQLDDDIHWFLHKDIETKKREKLEFVPGLKLFIDKAIDVFESDQLAVCLTHQKECYYGLATKEIGNGKQHNGCILNVARIPYTVNYPLGYRTLFEDAIFSLECYVAGYTTKVFMNFSNKQDKFKDAMNTDYTETCKNTKQYFIDRYNVDIVDIIDSKQFVKEVRYKNTFKNLMKYKQFYDKDKKIFKFGKLI